MDKFKTDQVKRVKEAFQVLDSDGDGMLSHSELKAVLQNLNQNWADKKLNDVILDIDKNGDGVISQEELLNWLIDVDSGQSV